DLAGAGGPGRAGQRRMERRGAEAGRQAAQRPDAGRRPRGAVGRRVRAQQAGAGGPAGRGGRHAAGRLAGGAAGAVPGDPAAAPPAPPAPGTPPADLRPRLIMRLAARHAGYAADQIMINRQEGAGRDGAGAERVRQPTNGGTAISPRATGTTCPATVAPTAAPLVAVTVHSRVDGRCSSIPCRTV